MSADWKKNLPGKVLNLFDQINPAEIFGRRDLVAVKLHFGEAGNTAHIRPQYVRKVVDRLKELHAKPFLTDTNTLYLGSRTEAWSHLVTAFDNGFTREVTGAPAIIADGLRGNNSTIVSINGRHVKDAHLAADIHYADGLVVLSHFKGHELTGFGGAIKNMGMGCAARKGKLAMHSNIGPSVNRDKCVGCMECAEWCASDAIEKKENKAWINPKKCVGCGLCIDICRKRAIKINWTSESSDMQRRMAEYASGAVKKKKTIFINFVNDISPACDCYSYNGPYLAEDIGILVSDDIVAIDSASYDLVRERAGRDVFRETHKSVNPEVQLEHAEKMGLGSRKYKLL